MAHVLDWPWTGKPIDQHDALVTIATLSLAMLGQEQSKPSVRQTSDAHGNSQRHTHNKASSTPSSYDADPRAVRSTHPVRREQSTEQHGKKRSRSDFIPVTDRQDASQQDASQHVYKVPTPLIPTRETHRDFLFGRKKEIRTYAGTIISVGAFSNNGIPTKAKIIYSDGQCTTEIIKELKFLY